MLILNPLIQKLNFKASYFLRPQLRKHLIRLTISTTHFSRHRLLIIETHCSLCESYFREITTLKSYLLSQRITLVGKTFHGLVFQKNMKFIYDLQYYWFTYIVLSVDIEKICYGR